MTSCSEPFQGMQQEETYSENPENPTSSINLEANPAREARLDESDRQRLRALLVEHGGPNLEGHSWIVDRALVKPRVRQRKRTAHYDQERTTPAHSPLSIKHSKKSHNAKSECAFPDVDFIRSPCYRCSVRKIHCSLPSSRDPKAQCLSCIQADIRCVVSPQIVRTHPLATTSSSGLSPTGRDKDLMISSSIQTHIPFYIFQHNPGKLNEDGIQTVCVQPIDPPVNYHGSVSNGEVASCTPNGLNIVETMYSSPSVVDGAGTSECSTPLEDDEFEDLLSETSDGDERSEYDRNFRPAIVFSTLRGFTQEVLDRVVSKIYTTIIRMSAYTSHAASGTSSVPMQSKNSSASFTTQYTTAPMKRDRGNRDSSGSDEERGDGSGKRLRSMAYPSTIQTMSLRFACPFFKRSPEKHTALRSCAGPGWDSVHRVKEHVYRSHARPITCQRCSTTFESETSLTAHAKSAIPCEVAPMVHGEGFTKDQEKRLRSRRRLPGQTEADRWVAMYRVLFPDVEDSAIPSPYCEHRSSTDYHNLFKFKEYLVEELPKKIQADMRNQFQLLPDSLRNSLGGKMVEIVRNCAEDVFRTYSRPMATPPATPPVLAKFDKPRTLEQEKTPDLVLNTALSTRSDPMYITSSIPSTLGNDILRDEVNNANHSTCPLADIPDIGGTDFESSAGAGGKEKLLRSDREISSPSSGFRDFEVNWLDDDVLKGFLSSLGPLDLLNISPTLHSNTG